MVQRFGPAESNVGVIKGGCFTPRTGVSFGWGSVCLGICLGGLFGNPSLSESES